MPDTLLELLAQLTAEFREAGYVDVLVSSVDSTLMHAQGNVWHARQMKTGELPSCGNLDVEAHWGMSRAKGWVFGYRLHSLIACGPAGVVWPLAAAVHPANVKDAAVFKDELAPCLPDGTRLILADSGYDDEKCVQACEAKEATLLTPVGRIAKSTCLERRERAELYRSMEGGEALALRKTTVEPFQGQLKELFGLEHLPMKGLKNVRALCTLSVVAYALLVKLNLRLERPLLRLKATLHSLR